jgi:hypothetical protein
MRENRNSGATGPAEQLRAEADLLHAVLFGGAAPEEIHRQYAEALRAASTAPIEKLLSAGVDLEALELALRKKNPFNPLTQRFRVLCYLAEARPGYFHRFVADRRGFFSGFFAVAFFALRSVYKALKGNYLARKHAIG